ncbi:ATP-binding protein [Solirubrobacter soli]|uniref:ATP-binding protein n=1 Tax=Solirubrobacter soli TaxID=363832 RepID=UPI00352FA963
MFAKRSRFAGRDGELERLNAAPRLVLVEGAAGVGKTALVRHFLAQHPELVVLRASGERAETGMGFGVLRRTPAAGAADRRRVAPARAPGQSSSTHVPSSRNA